MLPGSEDKAVVLYAAVSRGDAGRNQDPETQLGALRGVARRLRWTVAEEVVLRLSRWDPQEARRARGIAYEALSRTGADLLAVWAWDRFNREGVAAAFREIAHLEGHLGVGLYSYTEPFLCTGTDPLAREMMLPMVAWAARQESQRKSDRLTAKAEAKREAAARLGQRALWGGGSMPTPDEARHVLELRGRSPPVPFRRIAADLGLGLATVHRAARSGPPPPAGAPRPSDAAQRSGPRSGTPRGPD